MTSLRALVERAGAVATEAVTQVGRASVPSIRSMVEADLRGWLPVMGVDLDEPLILEILAEADRVLADYVSAEGRMEFEPKHLGSAVIANADAGHSFSS